jgi:hypothetical protein
MQIRTALRVRPFNPHESKELCIEMRGGTTTLLDLTTHTRQEFTSDFSFWSHDGFAPLADGYLMPTSPDYTDQLGVFEQVGRDLLDRAWQGVNCCVMAYGQCASGKTFSMMGEGGNKGLIPNCVEEIFRRIQSSSDAGVEHQVSVSMLEISNDKINDLLVPVSTRPPSGLKIKETKGFGVKVQGLTRPSISSFADFESLHDTSLSQLSVDEAVINRRGITAHLITTIELRQVQRQGGLRIEKLSKIQFVDIAGAERLSRTNVAGRRLKEATSVNKSLSALHAVISKLGAKTQSTSSFVPYRDSLLTRLLREALGGDCCTVALCTLSPSEMYNQETRKTLEVCSQLRQIVNHPTMHTRSVQERTQEDKRPTRQQDKLGLVARL